MKKAFFLALLISLISLLYSFTLHAQDLEDALLWKIEGKGIKTSYVFGTFHIVPKSDFVLQDKVKAALDSSDQLILEVDIDNPNWEAEVTKHVCMRDSMTMDQLMNKNDYHELDEELRKNIGVGIVFFNTWKPMLLSSYLYSNLIGAELESFELVFAQMATQNNKEILGLETVEEQLSCIDAIPYDIQINEIMKMLHEKDDLQSKFSIMLELYQNERINDLYAITIDYFKDEKIINDFLHQRNKNWIPIINNLCSNKSSFIGVGAGHLGGENGLITLLKSEGYSLTPLKD